MTKLLTRFSLAAALVLAPAGLSAQAPAPGSVHAAPADPAAPGRHPEPPRTAEAAAESEPEHGPAMVLFGRSYGNGPAFLVQLLNFAIYAGGLILILRGVLSAMFKSRREELEAALSRSERDRSEAEAQLQELEAKMAGLEGELAGILGKAESDAEAERQRVLESARAEAEQILLHAKAEIEMQQRQAEQELRALVAELAVEGAAARLEARLAGPAADRALDRAIRQIGGIQ